MPLPAPAGGEVMSVITFVVEFEEGKELLVHAHMGAWRQGCLGSIP